MIHDVSVREYVITLKIGQQYEFVVTATNKYGESLKEQKNIKRIIVLGGKVIQKNYLGKNVFPGRIVLSDRAKKYGRSVLSCVHIKAETCFC